MTAFNLSGPHSFSPLTPAGPPLCRHLGEERTDMWGENTKTHPTSPVSDLIVLYSQLLWLFGMTMTILYIGPGKITWSQICVSSLGLNSKQQLPPSLFVKDSLCWEKKDICFYDIAISLLFPTNNYIIDSLLHHQSRGRGTLMRSK